jgi:hypothetical protein
MKVRTGQRLVLDSPGTALQRVGQDPRLKAVHSTVTDACPGAVQHSVSGRPECTADALITGGVRAPRTVIGNGHPLAFVEVPAQFLDDRRP